MAEHTNHDPGHDHGHETNPSVSHERRDVNIFQIVAFGVGLVVSCIVVVFAMWAMFNFLASREDKKNPELVRSMRRGTQMPPEPRLQGIGKKPSDQPTTPRMELRDLVESEELILSSYGLLDPNLGIARIPIDQAIDIVAAKGLPSNVTGDGFRMIPLDSNGGRTLEKISQ